MTAQNNEGLIPEWTKGDRLRKARALTGLTVREFADKMGVSHGTITNAETDAREVRRITLNAWALVTGVSLEWLETGQGSPRPTPPTPGQGSKVDQVAELAATKRNASQRTNTHRYLAPAVAA